MGPFSKKPDEQAAAPAESPSTPSVSNDTSPKELVTTTPEQPVVKKEKHSKAFSFVSVLFLLMLLVAGVMTYLWYDQKGQAESLSQDVTAAEKTVSDLRASIAKMDDAADASLSSEPAAKTDDEQIKEMTSAHEHGQKMKANSKLTFSNIRKELPFAKVNVAVEGSGGYACWLKKSENIWVVMFCGQQRPEQEELDNWGMSATTLQ